MPSIEPVAEKELQRLVPSALAMTILSLRSARSARRVL